MHITYWIFYIIIIFWFCFICWQQIPPFLLGSLLNVTIPILLSPPLGRMALDMVVQTVDFVEMLWLLIFPKCFVSYCIRLFFCLFFYETYSMCSIIAPDLIIFGIEKVPRWIYLGPFVVCVCLLNFFIFLFTYFT